MVSLLKYTSVIKGSAQLSSVSSFPLNSDPTNAIVLSAKSSRYQVTVRSVADLFKYPPVVFASCDDYAKEDNSSTKCKHNFGLIINRDNNPKLIQKFGIRRYSRQSQYAD